MATFSTENEDVARSIAPSSHETQAEFPPSSIPGDRNHPMMNAQFHTSQHRPAKPASGQLSKETWENLKPVMRSLYMGEGGSLARVAQHLSDEYGFLPTCVLS